MPIMRYLDHRIEHTPMGGHAPLAYPAMKFEFIPGYVKQRTHRQSESFKFSHLELPLDKSRKSDGDDDNYHKM
jgi:hypothetical protein